MGVVRAGVFPQKTPAQIFKMVELFQILSASNALRFELRGPPGIETLHPGAGRFESGQSSNRLVKTGSHRRALHYPPQLQEFKNGAFRLAIDLKIPILPITGIDTWKVFWNTGKEYGSRPGVCHIYVHKPVETAHLSLDDADGLRDEVHELINKKLHEA